MNKSQVIDLILDVIVIDRFHCSSLWKYQSTTFIYAIGHICEQEIYQTNTKESGEIQS